MLQAHSYLWYYLWVGPNLLLLVLAFVLWRRGFHRLYPFFVAFAVVSALDQLALYVADISPAVSPGAWWKIFWAGLIAEGLLKFALIAEIFAHVFGTYPAVAKLGKFLIRGVGIVLVFAAAIAAAYAPKDGLFGIVSGAHLLEQTIYLIETGLLLFIFLFSAYFGLKPPNRGTFGIALGLAISACVHLGTWAVMANGGLPDKRSLLDLLNMATFQVCVLIWFYYLLVPPKVPAPQSVVPPPDNNLELWNRELERLLQ
jgi:hypothetical protein